MFSGTCMQHSAVGSVVCLPPLLPASYGSTALPAPFSPDTGSWPCCSCLPKPTAFLIVSIIKVEGDLVRRFRIHAEGGVLVVAAGGVVEEVRLQERFRC